MKIKFHARQLISPKVAGAKDYHQSVLLNDLLKEANRKGVGLSSDASQLLTALGYEHQAWDTRIVFDANKDIAFTVRVYWA